MLQQISHEGEKGEENRLFRGVKRVSTRFDRQYPFFHVESFVPTINRCRYFSYLFSLIRRIIKILWYLSYIYIYLYIRENKNDNKQISKIHECTTIVGSKHSIQVRRRSHAIDTRVFAYNCKHFSETPIGDPKTKIFPFDTPAEIHSLLYTFFSRPLPVRVCDRGCVGGEGWGTRCCIVVAIEREIKFAPAFRPRLAAIESALSTDEQPTANQPIAFKPALKIRRSRRVFNQTRQKCRGGKKKVNYTRSEACHYIIHRRYATINPYVKYFEPVIFNFQRAKNIRNKYLANWCEIRGNTRRSYLTRSSRRNESAKRNEDADNYFRILILRLRIENATGSVHVCLFLSIQPCGC